MRLEKIVTYDCNDECPMYLFIDLDTKRELKFEEDEIAIVHAMGYSLFKSIVHEKPFECIRRYPLRDKSGDWYRYPDSIYWYDLLFPFAETKDEYDFFKKAIEKAEKESEADVITS